MPDNDDYISINTNDITLGTVAIGDTTLDNIYTTTSPSTITLSMPEEEVFSVTPDFDDLDRGGEVGIDLVQELKRKFENE